MSRFGLVSLFLSTGALHLVDPAGIVHYGLPIWFSYFLAAAQILSAVAFLLGADIARLVFLAVAIAGAGFHLWTKEYSLLVLPTIPLVLLAVNRITSGPRTACACEIRLTESVSSDENSFATF